MKKRSWLFIPVILLAALVISCDKKKDDDDNTVEKFSTLSVEANKATVEDAGI